jgi:hypothetical protein
VDNGSAPINVNRITHHSYCLLGQVRRTCGM